MRFSRPLATLAGVAPIVALVSAANADTLRIQTSFNAGDFSSQFLTEHWLPRVAEMTDGRIELELLPNGAVVPHRETPEAVAAGILAGDFTSEAYFSGREPAFALLGDLISGYDTPAQMRGFCQDGPGVEVLQAALDSITNGRVVAVACGPYSREALAAGVPIRTFEDLAGKKIRSPEGLAAAVFAAAGATPVSIPFSEVYTSLERGIVDAADASAYVNNDATGLNQIARYPLYPGIHSMPSLQFTLNRDTWEGLSAEDQQALRQSWYDVMAEMEAAADAMDQELAARDDATDEIEVINWAQEDRDQLRAVARQEWETFAERSDLARQALDAHLAYMQSIGLLD